MKQNGGGEGAAAYLKENVLFVLAANEPNVGASTVTGPGRRPMIIINTRYKPSAPLSELANATVAHKIANELVAKGAGHKVAVRAMGRSIMLHEFGHVLDDAVGGRMTNLLVGTVRQYAPSSKEAFVFVRNHISAYGASSPQEAAAEAYALLASGRLPKALRDWGDHAKGK